jgi:hypothetical protein
MKLNLIIKITFLFLGLISSFLYSASNSLAQGLSISSPSITGAVLSSSPDFATEKLANPWDFDSSQDLGNFVKLADTSQNITIANGLLYAPSDSFFHLLSPPVCSANYSGKSGPAFYIDSTKYFYLSFRLYASAPSFMNLLVNLGCNYFENLWRSETIYLKAGWNTYTVDMRSIGRSSGSSTPWTAVPVTGLRMEPALASPPTIIDWVRLSGDGGEVYNINYNFDSGATSKWYSLFVDVDDNPDNGYEKALRQVTNSVAAASIDSKNLFPGDAYKVVGIESNDFATLIPDPWDMEQTSDLANLSNVTVQKVADGLSVTTTPTNSTFDLANHGQTLPANPFRYFRIDLTAQSATNMLVYAYNSIVGAPNTPAAIIPISTGRAVYTVDLGTHESWSGNITRLVINFAQPQTVILHDASLRSDGFGTSQAGRNIVTSAGLMQINQPPIIKILQPDADGGADYASVELGDPWNMDTITDVVNALNVSESQILPDNHVGGIQGNFYSAVSILNDYDPHQESLNIYDQGRIPIDASRYKNIVFKLLVDAPQDIVLGSVVRLVWRVDSEGPLSFYNANDTVTFEGWQSYSQDMRSVILEELQHPDGTYPSQPWYNQISHFRVDPHEFSTPTRFVYDFIRVTADDESNTQFLLTVDAEDVDTDPSQVTVSLFYNSSAVASGGTAIGSINLSQARHFLWNTSAVPNGEYYIYAIADDGKNSTSKVSNGRIVINHSRAQDSVAPILQLDNPVNGATLYNSFVASGYALDNIQLAKVDIKVDNSWVKTIFTGRFDRRAQEAYRSFAESGNAGFRNTVDLSSVSPGVHSMEFIAYDTAGNQTSSGVFSFTKISSADPSPFPEEAPSNTAPLPVPTRVPPVATPAPAQVTLGVKANKKANTLNFTVSGASTCANLSLFASDNSNLTNLSRMTNVFSGAGAATLKLAAKGVPAYKPKNKKQKLHVVVGCDSSVVANKALSVSSFKGKAASKVPSWAKSLKKKLKRTS